MAAVMTFYLLLMSWTMPLLLASVIPSQTENKPQEHYRTGYARPVMSPRPAMPVHDPYAYHRVYNHHRRPPTPAPPKPKSVLFHPPTSTGPVLSPTRTGTVSTGGKVSTGLSYINNLLTGVNNKIYGTPTGSSSRPHSGPGLEVPSNTRFEPPTHTSPGIPSTGTGVNSSPSWGIPSGTGGSTPTDTGLGTSTGTGFQAPVGNTDPRIPTGTGFGTPGINSGSDFEGPTEAGLEPPTSNTGSGSTGFGMPPRTGPGAAEVNLGTDFGTPTGTGFGEPGINEPAGPGFETPPISTDTTETGFGSPTGTGFGTTSGNSGTDFGPTNPGSDLGNTGTDFGTPDTGSDFGNTGTDFGAPNTGSDLGNTGTDFGNPGTGFGGPGSGGFPGGSGGPATDIFGPGLTPVALDIVDPTDPANPGNGSPNPPVNSGVVINNGPNQPPTSFFPVEETSTPSHFSPTTDSAQPGGQPGDQQQQPDQPQQRRTWVWPDDVITEDLPSMGKGAQRINSGSSSDGAQASSNEPASRTLQQSGGVSAFLQRG